MIRAIEFIKDEKVMYSKSLIENPLVSIILPTYCRGNNGMLDRAISSVLNQTFSNFELIIVDDGSVDRTQEVIGQYIGSDNRIVYIRNDVNSGLPGLRVNQGIEHSRGKYICYQFDDDQWRTDALYHLVNEIEKYSSEVVVYGAYQNRVENHEEIYTHCDEYSYAKLMKGNYIANNTVIHNRSLCEKYGMYDMHLAMRRLCDWDLWLRYGKEIQVVSIEQIISDVTISVENSLGTTVAYDINTSRMLMGRDKNDALTIANYKNYIVDDLSYFVNENQKDYVYNQHIVPWKLKHKELFGEKNIYRREKERQRVIVSKLEYDSTVNICLENYLQMCQNEYEYIYIPEEQLTWDFFIDDDILLLDRAVLESTLHLLEVLKDMEVKVTCIYVLDDNILKIHKISKEFSYIAPGTDMYRTVCKLISVANRVVVFSEGTYEEVKKHNEKVTLLDTNIPLKYLSEKDSYEENEKFTIVFAGGEARKEEFSAIENDLVRVAKKYAEKVKFVFWGYKPEAFEKIDEAQVEFVPYTTSYNEYRNRLCANKFNLLVCPLKTDEYRDCKCPVKFVEMTCSSALGIFSSTPVYSCINDGYNGFLVKDGESWYEKICKIIEMPIQEKQTIYNNARDTVIQRYTTEGQVQAFRMAIKAAQVAKKLGDKKILYISHSGYLAGAENHLFRHACISKEMGLSIVFAMPRSFENRDEVLQQRIRAEGIDLVYLPVMNYVEVEKISEEHDVFCRYFDEFCSEVERLNIGLIHSTTLIPMAAEAARRCGISYMASLYATESDYIADYADRRYLPDYIHSDSVLYANMWQRKIGCPTRCVRSYIPKDFYEQKHTEGWRAKEKYNIAISGTLQERKRQLQVIRAVASLKDEYEINLYIWGYTHFYKEYKEECDKEIRDNGLVEHVKYMGITEKIAEEFKNKEIDMLVCASTFESFPQVILEAMALEIPVVSTPVAGVPEMLGKNNGFVTKGFSEVDIAAGIRDCIIEIEKQTIAKRIKLAKRDLINECSKEVVSHELMDMYLCCINQGNARIGNALKRGHGLSFKEEGKRKYKREIGPYVNPEALCLSKLIKKEKRYFVSLVGRNITKIGLIFTAYYELKGKIKVTINAPGLMVRYAEKELTSIAFNKWTYFEIIPIYEYAGEAEVKISLEYENESGNIGVYERRENRSVMHRLVEKMQLVSKKKDVLLIDYLAE